MFLAALESMLVNCTCGSGPVTPSVKSDVLSSPFGGQTLPTRDSSFSPTPPNPELSQAAHALTGNFPPVPAQSRAVSRLPESRRLADLSSHLDRFNPASLTTFHRQHIVWSGYLDERALTRILASEPTSAGPVTSPGRDLFQRGAVCRLYLESGRFRSGYSGGTRIVELSVRDT